LFGKRGAGERHLENGNAGSAVGDDQWRRRACGQLLELRLGLACNLRNRHADVDAWMEEYLYDRDAIQ